MIISHEQLARTSLKLHSISHLPTVIHPKPASLKLHSISHPPTVMHPKLNNVQQSTLLFFGKAVFGATLKFIVVPGKANRINSCLCMINSTPQQME